MSITLEEARRKADAFIKAVFDPCAPMRANLARLHRALARPGDPRFADEFGDLRGYGLFAQELATQIAHSRLAHASAALDRSAVEDGRDYMPRREEIFGTVIPDRFPDWDPRMADDERDTVRALASGTRLSELRNPALRAYGLDVASELYPVDTWRWLLARYPDLITPEIVRRMGEAMVLGCTPHDPDQTDPGRIAPDLDPEGRRELMMGIRAAADANDIAFLERRRRYARRPLPTLGDEDARRRRVEEAGREDRERARTRPALAPSRGGCDREWRAAEALIWRPAEEKEGRP